MTTTEELKLKILRCLLSKFGVLRTIKRHSNSRFVLLKAVQVGIHTIKYMKYRKTSIEEVIDSRFEQLQIEDFGTDAK